MADFEKIEIDPAAVEAKYARPDFAKVVFHSIRETYPTDVNIECQYTVTASLTPHSRDWVGLYKVGWSSIRDYVYFLWASKVDNHHPGTELENTVVFQAAALPKDDGEFYQFCYVSHTGHVRGASTPFQFKRPSAEDYVEVVDEESDMMVIKCKTVALEEDLTKARKERDILTRKMKNIELERDSLLGKLVATEKDLKKEKQSNEELQALLKETQDKLQSVQTEARDMAMAHDGLKEKLNVLNQEKESILKRLDDNDKYISDLQEKLKNLLSEKDALSGKTKALEHEKEMLQNHFTSSESTIKGYLTQVMALKQQLEKQTENEAGKQREIDYLRSELETTQLKIRDLHKTSKNEKAEIDTLKEKLQNTEDQLHALENCKALLHDEVEAVKAAHHKMSQDLEIAKSETHSADTLVKRLKMTHEEERTTWQKTEEQLRRVVQEKDVEQHQLKEEIQKLEASPPASPVEEKEGSMFALQSSLDHLKERYARTKRDKEALNKQVEEMANTQKTLEAVEADLRSEVRDLRERLMMGAEEYKAKYLECRKLQSELKALRKTARGNSPSAAMQSTESNTEKTQAESSAVQTEAVSANSTHEKIQLQLDELSLELQDRLSKKQKYKQLYLETKQELEQLKEKHERETTLMEYQLEAEKIEKDRLHEELKRRLKEQEVKSLTEVTELQEEVTKLKAKVAELSTQTEVTENQEEAVTEETNDKPEEDENNNEEEIPDITDPFSDDTPTPINPLDLRVQVSAKGRTVYPGVAVLRQDAVLHQDAPITTEPAASASVELQEVVVTTPPKVPPRTYRRKQPPTPPNNSASSSAAASPPSSPQMSRHMNYLAAAMDPMETSQTSEDLSPPLTPLPPPIEPMKLHSAKSVKAVIPREWPGKATPVSRCDSEDGVAKETSDEETTLSKDHLMVIDDSDAEDAEETDAEDAEERFHDAAGDAQKLCPVCNLVFPTDYPQPDFEQHVDNHYKGHKTCPMCDQCFELNYDQEKFELHVNGHFAESTANF